MRRFNLIWPLVALGVGAALLSPGCKKKSGAPYYRSSPGKALLSLGKIEVAQAPKGKAVTPTPPAPKKAGPAAAPKGKAVTPTPSAPKAAKKVGAKKPVKVKVRKRGAKARRKR